MINGSSYDWTFPILLATAIPVGVFVFGGKTMLIAILALLSLCAALAGVMHLIQLVTDARKKRDANKPSEGTR